MENKPLFSFCTPVYNDGDTVKRMIQSILEQDYPNIEHILVNDGSKDKTGDILNKYAKKYPEKIKVIHFKQNKGACEARNEAASHAKGKYLSFLPADAKIYPGVVRDWVNRLEENPEYDFLYGGYSFIDDQGNRVQDYISEDFDPYLLEVTNYIDGSYPLKKALFDKMGGWDSSVKSLQDWDFWLNAVKKYGAKGLYVPDLFFETTLPHPGGLSFDSANNWLERTGYIKRKYGIREREICVASYGAPFHGKNTAKILDADYKGMPSFKPHNYKMIYLIGGYYQQYPHIVEGFKRHDGLRVLHWIGSDIHVLQQMKHDPSPVAGISLVNFLNYLSNNIDVNLCEYEQTQKELKEFGINARIVPLPPAKLYDLSPLPNKFTMAIYLPYINKQFYYTDLCMEIASEMSDISFKIFGDPTLIGKKHNIEHVGKIDYDKMGDFIKSCSTILRLTPHDGLPLSVCEFIMAGRNAVTSTPMKHVIIPKTLDKQNIKQAILECKGLSENKEGSKYYREILNHETFKKTIYDLMEYKPKEYWENRANTWNILTGENKIMEKEQEPEILNFIDECIKEVKPLNVLDVGCGNGNWVLWLKDRCKNYTGVDISENLLKICKEKYPNEKFIQSDILDFDKNIKDKYDLVFSFTTLLHIKPQDLENASKMFKNVAGYGIFIEPIEKYDRNMITNRLLPPIVIKEQMENQKIIHGVESSFVHNYKQYFKVLKEKKVGQRLAMFVELK